MKRLYLGIAILFILLALGSSVSWGIHGIHEPIHAQLQQAHTAALDADWTLAQRLSLEAQQRWLRWQHFTAAFADHAPMDEIDSLFAQLTVYAQAKDIPHFCALCAELAQLTHAMSESHSPTWWNLL